MKTLIKQDTQARKQALDPQQSFIVQAPAGSGKTELLVRRYLVLLTRVQSPESIIAVTFTRKAAAEMRLRVLQALENALNASFPSANEKERWQLAKKVLAHDKAQNWNLLTNPNRLRIQTIDSFCQTLTRQMPLLSTLAEQLTPIENPEFLYRLAAQELIASLETPTPWQKALHHVVKHLDNDFNHLENLLSELLSTREQWLSYCSNSQANLRTELEKNLFAINQTLITQLNQYLPNALRQELSELVNFSIEQRIGKTLNKYDDRQFWDNALILLLTTDDNWRKEVSKKQGFPSPSHEKNKEKKQYYSELKQRAQVLIQRLQEQTGLHRLLIDLKNAPPLCYTESQWATLAALFELLPVLVAHLKLIFREQQKLDYTEILLCALSALGTAENPTDLALSLDYQIEHILVDEFQDTSISQFQLIKKLTAGWQTEDGKTLFLVGDPMQSIYRFRKAEVGLFLQVRQSGIGNIAVKALNLSVNFRSLSPIVNWINTCFNQLLPQKEDINRGAITFSPAVAFQQTENQNAITTTWFDELHVEAEANKIVTIIQAIKQKNPQDSIALLVRARTHLLTLLPALQEAAIPYHALEIESLAEKSVIQDLVALTRALHHLGDRISWLALLRSPFCGLDLYDLHAITQFTQHTSSLITVWQQLTHFEAIPLKETAKQRCRRIVPILQQCLCEQGSLSLPSWIKKTWIALGGPTTLNTPQDMLHVQTYLNYLEKKILTEGDRLDLFKLEKDLAKLVTQNTTKSSGYIEIMTIHKAKGLEYDHVILPSLHRKGSRDSAKLWLYQEQLLSKQINTFLLAPIKSSQENEDAIYHYLLREERQKSHYELARLLYVACTRAKKSLHLLGVTPTTTKETKKTTTTADSLLQHLSPILHLCPQQTTYVLSSNRSKKQLVASRLLKRLPCDWQNPKWVYPKKETVTTTSQFSYCWMPDTEKRIGTVIHRLLYQISQDGLAYWEKLDRVQKKPYFIRLLEQAGIIPSQLTEALEKLQTSLSRLLQDPRGRWILSQSHKEAHSEFALTVVKNGKKHNIVIDRCLVDTSGTLWIIDYKTTVFLGNETSLFLKKAKQQHQEQLENYAAALAQLYHQKNYPIRLALYFPFNTLWCEWEYIPLVLEDANFSNSKRAVYPIT
jgi:ATP-dependent helicase/nuclease subunit A